MAILIVHVLNLSTTLLLYQHSVLQNDDINTNNSLEIHIYDLHLNHYVGRDEIIEGGIHIHGDEDNKTDKRPFFTCPLLGLSLPIEIIDRIDGGILDRQTDAVAIGNTLDDDAHEQTRITLEKSGIRDRIENTLSLFILQS